MPTRLSRLLRVFVAAPFVLGAIGVLGLVAATYTDHPLPFLLSLAVLTFAAVGVVGALAAGVMLFVGWVTAR